MNGQNICNIGDHFILVMLKASPWELQNSFMVHSAKADYKNGLSMRKGPIYMTDIFFDGFANNEYYKQGALGFSTKNKQSPLHSVTNALFGFSDVSIIFCNILQKGFFTGDCIFKLSY